MESELIAIGLVLLIVGVVLMAAVGAPPTPLDVRVEAVRVSLQAQAFASQVSERLPH